MLMLMMFLFLMQLRDIAAWEADAASLIAARGWSVKKTGNATASYNCHSYAWYRSEGGTGNWWINACPSFDYEDQGAVPTPPTNISKYWDDGSYLETTESQATKVYYGSCWSWNTNLTPNQWANDCDHSAVRITSGSDAGKYESKWGRCGRYVHAYNHCIYYTGNRRYYKKNTTNPVISGSTTLCNGSTASYSSNIWKTCYTWASSSNLSVTGSGSSVSVKANQNGSGWISIMNSGVTLVAYPIFVGPPTAPFTIGFWRSGLPAKYSFKVEPAEIVGTPTSYVWEIHFQSKINDLYDSFTSSGPVGTYSFPSSMYGSTLYVTVKCVNSCGTGIAFLPRKQFTPTSGAAEPEVSW